MINNDVNILHSSDRPPPPSLTFPKLMEIGGGGLKIFARKGGGLGKMGGGVAILY